MAFTESKAYCTSAPWMYCALVFLHIEIEDSFFQESNNNIFPETRFSSINIILDMNDLILYYHYSLKDGSLECEIRTCVIVYVNLPTLACLDFVKFSRKEKMMISYKLKME